MMNNTHIQKNYRFNTKSLSNPPDLDTEFTIGFSKYLVNLYEVRSIVRNPLTHNEVSPVAKKNLDKLTSKKYIST